MDHFKVFMKDEVTKVVLDRFTQSVMVSLRQKIVDFESTPFLYKNSMYINRSLTQSMIYKEGFISFPFNGFISNEQNQQSSDHKFPSLPSHFESDFNSSFQLIISQQVLESAISAAFQSGYLKIRKEIEPQFVSTLISNFDDIFDDDFDSVTIQLEAHENIPTVVLSRQQIQNKLKIKMSIMNPYNSDIPAAYIICDINMNVSLLIAEEDDKIIP